MTDREIIDARRSLADRAALWFTLALVLATTMDSHDYDVPVWIATGLFVRWGVARIAAMPAVPVAPLDKPFGYDDAGQ